MQKSSDIALFLRIFDAGSISAAARSLDLSVAVASQRLKRLEYQLGVRLFHRTTRQLHPTSEGTLLAEQGRSLVEDLDALTQSLSAPTAGLSGLLRLTTSVTFGRQYVSPLLHEFMALHPNIRIALDFNDQRHDLIGEGFDVAIRIGSLDDSTLVARRLASNRRVLCASPDYLERHGRPRTVKDLHRHQCLMLTSRHGRLDVWRLKNRRGEEHAARVDGRLEANQGESLRDAAVAGLGIAMHSLWHVCDDLHAGRLEVVLPRWSLEDTAIHAVMPQRRLVPLRVRTFVDFIENRLGGVPPWERRERPVPRRADP